MAASAGAAKGKAREPHPHPHPCPALTPADRENLHFLWARMFEEAEENGRLVIIKFFTDYPETKVYFKTIPTEGKLQSHPLLSFHARRVMVAMNQVFQHLGNWERTCKLLECLADKHKNTHRVPVGAFQGMFRSMLRICQDLLGNEFTDDMLASWEKLFAAVQTEITAAYARL